MKKRAMFQSEMKKRFQKEILDRKQLNFLIGGDGNGGQGGTDDPWDPNG